jgi:hypothetical protein
MPVKAARPSVTTTPTETQIMNARPILATRFHAKAHLARKVVTYEARVSTARVV